MTVGVLAATQERAQYIIRTQSDELGLVHNPVPLSPRSLGYRGRQFSAIYVDPDLWPVSDKLIEKLGPCLYLGDGDFYTRLSDGELKTMSGMSREEFEAADDLYEEKVRELHPSEAVVERLEACRKEVERLRWQIRHGGDHVCDECWPIDTIEDDA
jgi:hypothetical protein